jgi:hypothetical protein
MCMGWEGPAAPLIERLRGGALIRGDEGGLFHLVPSVFFRL